MNIICGPEQDQRTITINLPKNKSRIGVLVSGGLDSAILYYLLLLENKLKGNIHEILPITVMRKEGSKYFSNLVVGHINQQFNIPYSSPIIVGDNTLPEEDQVKSGVNQAINQGFDIVYAGVIEQLPQHMINWQPIPSKETPRFKTPFQSINKSHVIDMIVKLKQEPLFYITHSCSGEQSQIGRCNGCNGCNERSWGFSQLSLIDPGTL
jgi:7-cyano-7-deazaguanine synthase in queuosine biosynthesis